MALKTTEEQLAEVQSRISALLCEGQGVIEWSAGSERQRQSELSELHIREQALYDRLAAEQGGGFFLGVPMDGGTH